jgi:hypothetical protein
MLQAGRSRDRVLMRWILPNPSSRTMALGSTQPLTEMSTTNLLGGKGRPVRKAYNLIAILNCTASYSKTVLKRDQYYIIYTLFEMSTYYIIYILFAMSTEYMET